MGRMTGTVGRVGIREKSVPGGGNSKCKGREVETHTRRV